MKYLCLRNCFVNARLWVEGRTYEIPDNMEKSPKNFKLVGETKTESPVVELNPFPFVCSACGKQVKSRIALVGHMRSHRKSGAKE